MPTDSNHHARNLTVYSFCFILYWLLGLEPTDDSIRLTFVNFTIHNTTVLPYITHCILIYFAWRFYLDNKSKFISSYVSHFNKYKKNKKTSSLYKKLKKETDKEFEDNYKKDFLEDIKPFYVDDIENIKVQTLIKSFTLEKYENEYYPVITGSYYIDPSVLNGYSNTANIHSKRYNLILKKKNYLHILILRFIYFTLTTDDSANFLLPWVLFLLAITTSILRYFCIDFV